MQTLTSDYLRSLSYKINTYWYIFLNIFIFIIIEGIEPVKFKPYFCVCLGVYIFAKIIDLYLIQDFSFIAAVHILIMISAHYINNNYSDGRVNNLRQDPQINNF